MLQVCFAAEMHHEGHLTALFIQVRAQYAFYMAHGRGEKLGNGFKMTIQRHSLHLAAKDTPVLRWSCSSASTQGRA